MRSALSHPRTGEVLTATSIIVGLTALGAAHGGYFPTAWGWPSVITLWITLMALVLRPGLSLSKAQWLTLGGIAGLTAWTFASVIWSSNVTNSVLEGERSIVYLGIIAAGIIAIPNAARHVIPGSVLAAISLLCGWGVLTRVFPDRMGYSPTSDNAQLLLAPLGYHSAEGMVAAMGLILALGMACRGRWWWRVSAAAVAPMLALTIILTLSRGGVATFIIGYAAMLAFERQRLRLLATTLVLLPAVGAVVVASAHYQQGWSSAGTPTTSADHHLAAALLACMALSAATCAAVAYADARWAPAKLLRRAFAGVLVALALAAAFGFFAVYGTPLHIYRTARHALTAAPPTTTGVSRVTNLSLNNRNLLWSVARDGFAAHPLIGSGAGTFEQRWYRERAAVINTEWAHSLYLGIGSDLGVVGLFLVIATLVGPLVAGAFARANLATVPAFGAVAGYVAHTGVDWDWQLPGATAPALLLAVLLLSGQSIGPGIRAVPRVAIGGALVAALLFAAIAWEGNRALDASASQLRTGNWAGAAWDARRAHDWAPWSYQPWVALGQADSGDGQRASAAAAYAQATRDTCGEWQLWLYRAATSQGAERRQALRSASWLNPTGPEVVAAIKALAPAKTDRIGRSDPCG